MKGCENMLLPNRRLNFLDDALFENSKSYSLMNTDIIENDNEYEFKIDLPGFDKENIQIEIDNGQLIIHAKKERINEEKTTEKFIKQERYYGEFKRSFYVGDDFESDDVTASFNNGVLTLIVPKKENNKESKKYIEIK